LNQGAKRAERLRFKSLSCRSVDADYGRGATATSESGVDEHLQSPGRLAAAPSSLPRPHSTAPQTSPASSLAADAASDSSENRIFSGSRAWPDDLARAGFAAALGGRSQARTTTSPSDKQPWSLPGVRLSYPRSRSNTRR